MISDPTLFVQCDSCGERVQFSFASVLRPDWQADEMFAGWEIDWAGRQGDALCPTCHLTTRRKEES